MSKTTRQIVSITLVLSIVSLFLLVGCDGSNFAFLHETTVQSSEIATQETVETKTEVTDDQTNGTNFQFEISDSTDIVDENINAESLTEDQKLTQDAIAKNAIENAIIVPDPAALALSDTGPGSVDQIDVVRRFNSEIPDSIVENLKYSEYKVAKDYILITSSTANIRELPDSTSKILSKSSYFAKVTVLAEVKGEFVKSFNTDLWYEVIRVENDQPVHGYILSALAQLRTFQFEKMSEAIAALKNEVDNNKTAYISNYKNSNGLPPYYSGAAVDAFGTKRYQSAPAYSEANTQSEFRYIEDGTLVSILAESDTFYQVRAMNFEGEYYVPKRYVSFNHSIDQLTQVIMVDRNNQNEGVFEYVDDQWHIISYIYATTGETAQFKEPTSLGYFMAIQKVEKFMYLDDVTKLIAGYAPYGIRFGGGAYIHGVPVDSVMENGVSVLQPMQEYLFTIGTVPRSHKCVRNYTSHAKFLLDWCEVGQAAVIVIE